MNDAFGVLTMAATGDAVVRACGLAASLQVHEPDLRTCVLVPSGLAVPDGYFDEVRSFSTPEPYSDELRFLNKLVHPLALSPFARTLFIDDDMIAVRPFVDAVEEYFGGRAVALNTTVQGPDDSWPGPNHLDPGRVCAAFGITRCHNTGGGGHFYFEDGEVAASMAFRAIQFATSRRTEYRTLARQDFVSDEIALLLALNEARQELPSIGDFVDALSLSQANRIWLDVRTSEYVWDGRPWGQDIARVRLLHFANNAKRAISYGDQLLQLTGRRQNFDEGLVGRARKMNARARRATARLRRAKP